MKFVTTGILIAAAMTFAGSVANSDEDKKVAASLSVYDSGNALMGAYYRNPALAGNWEFVLLTSSGISFYAAITSLGFQTNGGIYYTTADCSSPAYLDADWSGGYVLPTSTGQPTPPLVTTASVIGNTAYVSGGAISTIVFLGYTDTAGTCQVGTGQSIHAQQVVKKVNLSSFVPPFSVH